MKVFIRKPANSAQGSGVYEAWLGYWFIEGYPGLSERFGHGLVWLCNLGVESYVQGLYECGTCDMCAKVQDILAPLIG